MKASVILPTYNGEQKLRTTLGALVSQTFRDFEVIVVIDGSTDRTESVAQEFESRLPKLVVFRQENKGRSGARNAGATLATTDLLIFIDDDIEVLPDNVSRHVEFSKQHKNAVLVGNPVLDSRKIGSNTFLTYRAEVEKTWTAAFQSDVSKISFQNFYFSTQNVSIPKATFNRHRGFDERLTDSEDFDLCVRLLLAQEPVFFDKTLMVYHNDFPTIDQTIKRQIQYYRAKDKLLVLHPEYKSLIPGYFDWKNTSQKESLKSLVFGSELWKRIFNSSLYRYVPRKLQYILFSAYVHTHSVVKVKNENH
jgi:glycosyltransferase involved in cell wall biosynthesis